MSAMSRKVRWMAMIWFLDGVKVLAVRSISACRVWVNQQLLHAAPLPTAACAPGCGPRISAGTLTQCHFHCIEERTQAKRDILDAAIDEKSWSRTHSTVPPALNMFSNPLQINLILHLD